MGAGPDLAGAGVRDYGQDSRFQNGRYRCRPPMMGPMARQADHNERREIFAAAALRIDCGASFMVGDLPVIRTRGAAALLAPCALAGDGCSTPRHAASAPAIHIPLYLVRIIS